VPYNKINPTLAWHFTDGRKLRGGKPFRVGQTIRHDEPLVLCDRGLHASTRIIDALAYAPGPYLSRVECSGEIITADDKLVCSRRKVIWCADASPLLTAFARWCAIQCVGAWDASDSVLKWLRYGRNKDRAATSSAARSAASSAAKSATYYATYSAARSAANFATYSAARSAAYSAAYSATKSEQAEVLLEMVEEWRSGIVEWEWEF